MTDLINKEGLKLPLVALRDMVVFPRVSTSLDVGRKESVAAVRSAAGNDRYLIMLMQKTPEVEMPQPEDLYTIGTVAKIEQMIQLPGGIIRILVKGVSRVRVSDIERNTGHLTGTAVDIEETHENPMEEEAYRRNIMHRFFDFLHETKQGLPDKAITEIRNITNPGHLADFVASQMQMPADKKQKILEDTDVTDRIKQVFQLLNEEIEIGEIETRINAQVRSHMEKEQRDYFLRQKIKSIHDQLGDNISEEEEAEEYRQKLEKSGIPKEYKAKLRKEIARLETMPPMMAESAIIRNYLDWVFDIPWTEESKDNLDLEKTKQMLDEDHYGLEKIKERILEYLSVRILSPESKGPILCFVGPPGVGKTSLAQSIARALGRNFARISLGGVHDEAEIRGHRRTYIGAMPGRFIEAMQQAKTINPLLLLDEIDKVGNDFRGDPASALLEALDPEQNKEFHDNYIDIPYDLSKVFFIATANTLSTIPAALLDRMEVISLSGYTEGEKLEIAKKYLVPRQRKQNGLKASQIKFSDTLLRKIIRNYTREAGVRELERTIGSLCRKVAKKVVMHDESMPELSARTYEKYLGPVKYMPMAEEHPSAVGRVNGLAWTAAGGEVLDTEAVAIPGKGRLTLTGRLGDVMKESATAAYTYVKSRASDLKLKEDFWEKLDLHLHFPEGAVPKDGPSAGVTIATAIASAVTGRKVRSDTAMTGEINLLGEVLPIGGVKEKVLAADQLGIKQVLLPEKNRKDLEEVPDDVKKRVHFVFVKNADDVLKHALM